MWVNVDSSCRDIELEVKLDVVGDSSTGEVVTGVVVVALCGRAGGVVVRLWLDWRLLLSTCGKLICYTLTNLLMSSGSSSGSRSGREL